MNNHSRLLLMNDDRYINNKNNFSKEEVKSKKNMCNKCNLFLYYYFKRITAEYNTNIGK